MNFLFIICLLMTGTTLEEKIKLLNPNVSKSSLAIVKEVLKEQLPILGLDENLVLSVISKESNFQRSYSAGSSGEWGMLQVIPSDKHIQRAALKYRCSTEEMTTPLVVNYKTIKLCRCSLESNENCNLPNIGSFVGNSYKVNAEKLALFFKYSPRAALFVGLYELKYWKTKYESSLRGRYWDAYPAWMFPKEEKYKRWWLDVKKTLGRNLWVVHHNYGGTIKTTLIGLSYPRMIYKTLKKLEGIHHDKKEIYKDPSY